MSSTTRSIITIGMDVHKDSITLAVLPDGAPAPTRVDRLPNDLGKLRRYCDRLAEQGELRACYEASGAGYVLMRYVATPRPALTSLEPLPVALLLAGGPNSR